MMFGRKLAVNGARVNKLASVLHCLCFFMRAYVYAELRNRMSLPGRALKRKFRRIGAFVFLTAEQRAELENVS